MMIGIVAGQGAQSALLSTWDRTVCQFQFDGNAADDKGGAFTEVGVLEYTTGVFGQALSLAGPTQAVPASGIVSDSENPLYGFAGDFTIEFYARITSAAPNSAVVAHFHTNDSVGWEVYYNANSRRLQWYKYDAAGAYLITSSQNAGDGVFRRYAVTRSGAELRMYFDTTLVGSATDSTVYGSAGLYLSVGYQAQGAARYPFRGLIDSLRIVNGIALDMSVLPSQPFPSQ